MAEERKQLSRGLKDVYFDTTKATLIDGRNGRLFYRGYNIHDLAENSSFEEVIHLLLYGELPTVQQLDQLNSTLVSNRNLSKEVIQIIELVKNSSPMDALRTSISSLSSWDPDVADNSPEAIIRKGLRLTAQSTTIVAAHYRIQQGMEIIEPDPTLSHAANFLYMLSGEKPAEEDAKLLDVDFVLHAEHSSNASAFAARLVASTFSDLHSAIVAAIGALKGPSHGGAAEAVMKMAEEIGSPDKAKDYAKNIIDNGGRVMGFGHRVYKVEDPRARHLRDRSRELGHRLGDPKWYQILSYLEQHVMEPYRSKGIYVNVDFYAGSIYSMLDIPEGLFVPIFALGRLPGWTLQFAEQYSNNILIRPRLDYVGPVDLEYVPIEKRH